MSEQLALMFAIDGTCDEDCADWFRRADEPSPCFECSRPTRSRYCVDDVMGYSEMSWCGHCRGAREGWFVADSAA